ncbi:MAG: GTPase domain-containing protein [Deltaproteobacteria bacterium]|nr:GTPase domain-containing protein [Deltaproteobacteria bacterium]
MAFIDFSKREIQCKIVYYGPGRGGKTTNLLYIHKAMTENVRGKMVSIDTKGDRTLFFDFLPLSLGSIHNMSIKIQLYTVPGQVMYNASRKLVLKGVDGVVFVADSLRVRRANNLESLANLEENLRGENLDMTRIPLVLQYNKRDLADGEIPLMTIEELDEDLNSQLHVPSFPGSAIKGTGVFETLREISKITVKQVHEKLLKR